MDSRDNEGRETVQIDHVYSVDSRLKPSGRWWDRSLQFPCPIEGHVHELTFCDLFFQLTPKERQEKSRGRTTVPMNMLCTGCVAFTKWKRFSPHNLLFCKQ